MSLLLERVDGTGQAGSYGEVRTDLYGNMFQFQQCCEIGFRVMCGNAVIMFVKSEKRLKDWSLMMWRMWEESSKVKKG